MLTFCQNRHKEGCFITENLIELWMDVYWNTCTCQLWIEIWVKKLSWNCGPLFLP